MPEVNDQLIEIHVRYFASLREQRGIDAETVSGVFSNVSALYEFLKSEHDLDHSQEELRPAVNNAYVSWDHSLTGDETVVFIPPVCGG